MNKLMTTGTLGLAGLVAAGLVAWQVPAFAGSGSDRDTAFKREDDSEVLVTTVDDDDDDDTGLNTRTRTGRGDNTRSHVGTNTGNSRSRADNTNSRVTAVSRDRDRSRGDLTRDRTNDGPGKNNRDWSANTTNDRSRNDTRR